MRVSWGIANFCIAAQAFFNTSMNTQDSPWLLNRLQLDRSGSGFENQCEQWSDAISDEAPKCATNHVGRAPSKRSISTACILQYLLHVNHNTYCMYATTPTACILQYLLHVYHNTCLALTSNYIRACRIRLHEVLGRCSQGGSCSLLVRWWGSSWRVCCEGEKRERLHNRHWIKEIRITLGEKSKTGWRMGFVGLERK